MNVDIPLLPRDDYPNGAWFRHRKPASPKLVRFNMAFGFRTKKRRMQAQDVWFL